MKESTIYQLKTAELINHKHYGICKVDGLIPEFGVKIVPESKAGLWLLTAQSGMPEGTPLLETSFRLITHKVTLSK